MSLSFQLVRGYLALPLLAVLAGLAWRAPSPQVSPVRELTALHAAHFVVIAEAPVACRVATPAPTLRLALAPADYRPVPRRDPGCHA